ncbi:MAG: methylmalonyl Co-A mutase-associated GTPase MeaB [Deltaproteobacteria bacterium]|jgi:LAO/AO transport system kinase|nr:methylmalonyl Co-A mutase-associated GTPase MeaB [Deltaproteobacteria bacterium]MBW2532649.1 methylmalonyl Co-A mutase-associated GTPase MeaB [Deltaproteobacteria bacterium]
MHGLAERLIDGEIRALARACRLVDDGVGEYRAILKDLFAHTGAAWTVGITGTPGAGKSTLTDKLILELRKQDRRVGVIAVDPTSPFSGGAILGDRIRMQRHHGDPEVFIRSVATRGALGGLSRSAADLVRVLDAWGADVVLIETVGVGQDELEVTRTADTTLVVMAPGMGDEVQAIKAGILECADVFAVNKADREGADATARHLELLIGLAQDIGASLRDPAPAPAIGHHVARSAEAAVEAAAAPEAEGGPVAWTPTITRCVATEGQGVADLLAGLEAHQTWLTSTASGRARRMARLAEAMRNQLRDALLDAALDQMADRIDEAVRAVASHETDPYTAAEELVAAFQGDRGEG